MHRRAAAWTGLPEAKRATTLRIPSVYALRGDSILRIHAVRVEAIRGLSQNRAFLASNVFDVGRLLLETREIRRAGSNR